MAGEPISFERARAARPRPDHERSPARRRPEGARSLEHSPIVLVHDRADVLRDLESILIRAGFRNVHAVTDARLALPLQRELEPDLLVLGIDLPGVGGIEIMQQVRAQLRDGEYFPFLVIAGQDRATRLQALGAGATDFISTPFDPLEVATRVLHLLRARRMYTRLTRRLHRRTARLRQSQIDLVDRLGALAELRDYGDAEHPRRVGRLAAALGQALGLPRDEVALLRRAAALHDIGKAAIPDDILLRPGPLNTEEMDLIRSHATIGGRMLAGSRSRLLQMAEEIALFHHEAWDGSGYAALAGDATPLVGRIVAVADVFDALTHERPYQEPWPPAQALDWIRAQAGRKFDPDVVAALVDTLRGPAEVSAG